MSVLAKLAGFSSTTAKAILLLKTADRGISAQDLDSHQRFATKHGFAFPLLSDPDKAVAREYGTLGPIGFPRRSVFIIDADGIVRYAHRAIAGLTFRPASELVAILQSLPAQH